MSTKKEKTKVAAKRKRREPAKRRASAKRTEPAMQYRNKATEQQKHTVPDQEPALENPGKWKLAVGPMETVSIAENAPLCQMVVQNLGPAVVEVRCENDDPVVLMQGKLALMSAYGSITVESVEENWATVGLDFMPRTRESSWY